MVIEILSVSCSVLFLVKADGDHFVVPNCKKSKWLNAKIFPVLYPVIFSKGRHLEGLSSFNFETTHCKNNFDTIWSNSLAVIKILSFSYSALLLVTANGGNLGMPNCKKSKRLHRRNILARSWINTNQWFLSYRHFHCLYAIFSNGPWRPSWIVFFYINMKWFH